MKRILFGLLILLATALLLSACAADTEEGHLEQIRERGTLIVGTSADFAPFEYVDEQGNLAGFDIELIREIGERMALEVDIQDMPFDSILAAVQEGKIDIAIAGLNYTEERDEQVDFTDPYFASETVLIVREDFDLELASSEDVANLIVGTQNGTTADSWITDALIEPGLMPMENLFRYERPEQGALDLKAGRLDAYAIDSVPAASIAQELGGLKVIRLNEESLEEKPMNIVVPEGDDELAEAINEVLVELEEEGYLEELAEKYIYEFER